jgi:hypothetical protein
MGALGRIGPPVSPAAVSRLLSRYGRPEIESFVAVAIDLLDLLDPDPDLEDGDEAGQCDEDEVSTNLSAACGGGPGCLISDEDAEHDGREEELGVY